ncbi:hypothetical protein [Kitasatospora sp. NPDC093806]|uniref:hypothetical protein n=1 Tax=Kitasatospora sp. NPDC093806 TaxID=3155075 RepID=UPI00342EA0EC
MNARSKDAGAPGGLGRAAGTAGHVLAQGLFLLAGLAAAVLGFGWFAGASEASSAYRGAPACDTAAPGADCVRHESGKVTARERHSGGDSTTYTLTVARENAPRHTYTVSWEFYDDAKPGTDVDLTLYRGKVAEVSYREHRATDPDTPWLTCFKVALLAGLGAALTALGLAWTRPGGPAPAFGFGLLTACLALAGSLALVSAQLPLAAALAVPVLGWLVMTGTATAATRHAA